MLRRHILQRKLLQSANVFGQHRGMARECNGERNLFDTVPLARNSLVHVAFQFGVNAQRRQLELFRQG